MLLCLDTSHGAGVALLGEPDEPGRPGPVLARRVSADPRRHTEVLALLIDGALADAGLTRRDLTAVAVGTGPAPFTGLRVGLVTARTLATALGLPIHGVSALDALARQAFDAGPDLTEVLVATDARRKEVYWGRYAPAGEHDVHTLAGPDVDRPAELAARLAGDDRPAATGRGVDLYAEEFGATIRPVALAATAAVDPTVLGRVARARQEARPDAAQPTTPLYLRRPDIHTSPGRKRAS